MHITETGKWRNAFYGLPQRYTAEIYPKEWEKDSDLDCRKLKEDMASLVKAAAKQEKSFGYES